MLDINKINFHYGQMQVLWDISFSVDKGETVTIIGSNASGKTTVLRTISGLLKPTSGNISFYNKRIDELRPYDIVELGIVQVPEGRRIFSQLTVLENLEMGAYTRKARKNFSDTLDYIFNLFPILKERKEQLGGTLSGGEQQMLAIGRGLMSRPEILMLDEPSLGLAPKIVLKMYEMLKNIVEDKEKNITILLVEQNVRFALQIADKGYVLETGKIVLEGDCESLSKNEHIKKSYLGM